MLDPETLRQTLIAALNLGTRVPPTELGEFVQRFWIFLTSCDARRFGQWEYVSWWDFVRAEGKSAEYQQVLAQGLTRTLVAAKEKLASSRTIAYMGEAFLMNVMGRGNDGEPDRLLNAPTNEAWIDPWVAALRELGVEFRMGGTVEAINVDGGRLASARVRDAAGRTGTVEADWFVCAVPVERAVQLWSPEVLALDPGLRRMQHLVVDWMNGLQFYLRREASITPGHIAYLDSPWALTSISQAQFWENRDFTRDYGDGTVRDCLSVDISDWDTLSSAATTSNQHRPRDHGGGERVRAGSRQRPAARVGIKRRPGADVDPVPATRARGIQAGRPNTLRHGPTEYLRHPVSGHGVGTAGSPFGLHRDPR